LGAGVDARFSISKESFLTLKADILKVEVSTTKDGYSFQRFPANREPLAYFATMQVGKFYPKRDVSCYTCPVSYTGLFYTDSGNCNFLEEMRAGCGTF
jgi:hypothetical protein